MNHIIQVMNHPTDIVTVQVQPAFFSALIHIRPINLIVLTTLMVTHKSAAFFIKL
jgi:hypothetical protein